MVRNEATSITGLGKSMV